MNKLLYELLADSSLYSLEFTGIISFKFSININSKYYPKYDDIIIEFVSGCVFTDLNSNLILKKENIFDFVGLNISNCFLEKDNVLQIILDEQFSIKSKIDNFDLLDRYWVLHDIKNEFYMINDGYQILKSDNW
ncbi:MAG: hypothetical protein ACRC8Z_06835 [Empedobacter falsenii]